MAQSGFTPISIYYSTTASAVPTAANLVPGELAINTNDGKLYYEDSSGVVQVLATKGGVGTSSTTQVLYNSSGLVVGSAGLTYDGTNLTTTGTATATRFIPSGSTVATNGMYLPAANSLGFSTNSAEAIRIDSSGLTTIKNANNAGAIWGECTSASFTDVVIRARAARNTTNGTFTAIEYYNTGAAAFKFYVIDSGAIYSTSIVITAISDERLKENIRDIDTGLSTIMALKPRRFDWKEGQGQDKKNVAGFIAQEFENVFPECVSTSKAGGDGIEYKNINHETLIPTLVKAIQDQQALIESLTSRLTALENK